MPSSIKLTEPLDILVEYGYLDEDIPYHKALSNAVMDFAENPTLGGEYNKDYVMLLQDEAKKELRLRRKKIDVKSFKEKFLNRKEEPVVDKSQNPPISFDSPLNPDVSLPEGEEQKQETEGLKGIRDILDDILKVLRLDFKGDRKEARDARKAKLDADRKAKENKLEGGGLKKSLGLIGSSAKALLSPFQSIWDAILNFVKFTFLGVLLNDTLDWFKDPENQKKAERVGKFLKDFGPVLATAALLWLTPLGGLLNGVVGLLTAIIPKLVLAIAANPYAALAVIGTGVTIWGVHKLAGELSLPDKAVNESVEDVGRQETISALSVEYDEKLLEFQESRNIFRKAFLNEELLEIEKQIDRLEKEMKEESGGNSMGRFNGGGLVQNYNEGGLVQSTQNYNEGGLVQSTQNYNEGGLVQSTQNYNDLVQSTQNYNEGGLVQHYNDQQSAQNFLQKYNQGGLVQNYNNLISNYKEGGLVQNYNEDGFVNNYQNFKGGGLVETYNNLTKIKNYKQGGFVSGPGGVDKVPARLTAGEFVMSKGAVQKFGVNTLASMNAAGGGTNVPTITQEYNQGGSVQYLEQEYNQGGVVQYLQNGGVVGDVMKEPVGTPIVQSTNRTITLPTIPKQQQDQKVDMTENDIPDFRIPIISSQRSMILSSLGIQDLIGG